MNIPNSAQQIPNFSSKSITYIKRKEKQGRSGTIVLGWIQNISKLVPNSNDVEEVHGASTTSSQLTSYDSYQNSPRLVTACPIIETILTEMKVVRSSRCILNKVHKWNATQGSLDVIKALSPIKREMRKCKIRHPSQWSNNDVAI